MEKKEAVQRAKTLLDDVKNQDLVNQAVDLAAALIEASNQQQTAQEKRHQGQLASMVGDLQGKYFTMSLVDQCFRTKTASRVADQVNYLIHSLGIPSFLPRAAQWALSGFSYYGKACASFLVPTMNFLLRREMKRVVITGGERVIEQHINKRTKEGIRINVNHLGEAVLGEGEALRRLEEYLHALKNPNIEYISVKISTICSRLNVLAWDKTIALVAERLRQLYREAQQHTFRHADGRVTQKFVNLDMEEYRDLHLTLEVFKQVLGEEEFTDYRAGIVLQAYLPDSYVVLQQLIEWALDRVQQGGAPIKVRLVKGANLAMEQYEASIKGWEQAPYATKEEVDANFKRMLNYACTPERTKAVNLGIGSHNIFDIAYTMLLSRLRDCQGEVGFEMLEGMADAMRRVVHQVSGSMLLYSPTAHHEEFHTAVAYLVRRLDENTAPKNFLRCAFGLTPGSTQWEQQVEAFRYAFSLIDGLESDPRRNQNRNVLPVAEEDTSFVNEADTDFVLEHNRAWLYQAIRQHEEREKEKIPVVIGGQELRAERKLASGVDPSKPGAVLYEYYTATKGDINIAYETADSAFPSWKATSVEERAAILSRIAQGFREHRDRLIAVMMADGGKLVTEADVEISEAIDFAEYYRSSLLDLSKHKDVSYQPKGTVLIAPPWNFPCAIPAGGVLAALAAGNVVLFKPARHTILIAWTLVQIFWEAGVPKKVLQFIVGPASEIGDPLILDPRLNAVILTGATETARHMLSARPDLDVMAETGGKNGIIVTNMADRDLAIRDIVYSAFGHAGQKCSACSLAILEKEVYHDPHFIAQLRDAAASLVVGSPWQLNTEMNPLIFPPEEKLLQGLTQLDAGEEWVLKPQVDPKNPALWTPGIKKGVAEGSFSHQTEFFGPVLSIMEAEDLDHAIRLANGTRYGLTSGLHSLDEREHAVWLNSIVAGNLYINRTTTGAIVQRQPFGGCKDSCIGFGLKAGGENYLLGLLHTKQVGMPSERSKEFPTILSGLDRYVHAQSSINDELWKASIESYAFWSHYFAQDRDDVELRGQDNWVRYIPREGIVIRLTVEDTSIDVIRIAAAATICDTSVVFSFSDVKEDVLHCLREVGEKIRCSITCEKEEAFLLRVQTHNAWRIRVLGQPSDELFRAAAISGAYVYSSPVLANGRLELLHYMREVSISKDYHRYGNLGLREEEEAVDRFPAPSSLSVASSG